MPVRPLLSGLLCLALLASGVSAAVVQAQTPPSYGASLTWAFPFVPNGEHYGGTGPWYGTVVLQNPEAVPLDLDLRTANGTLLRTVRVEPRAHATVAASDLFGPCRSYPATVRQHTPDGIDRVVLPTATLAVDRVEVAGFQPGVDFTWSALADEVLLDWSLPGWEPQGTYTVTIVDCPDGQPILVTASAPSGALAADATACVTRTRPLELVAVKGALDTADAVPLPNEVGTVTVVEVRYGTRYWGSLGLADPSALDTSGRWQATVSGRAVSIHWNAASNDDDGGIPTGARYSVVLHVLETTCREPRVAAQLLLTAGRPARADGATDGATLVSSLPARALPDPTSLLVLPIVQWHNGWTTVLHLAHRSSQSCAVTVTVRDGSGRDAWNGSRTLAAGQVWHLDLRDLALPSGFVGSGWARSSCGVLASADRLKPSHQLALTSPAVEVHSGPTTLLLPIVYAAHSGWNTGVALTNLAATPVTVDLEFSGPNGASIRLERRTLGPMAQAIVYRPDLPPTPALLADPNAPLPALATLLVRATGPVAVSADTVKYTPTGGRAFTLPVEPPVPSGTSLLGPLVLAVPGSDATGIAVANATLGWAQTTVELWPLGGPVPLRIALALPARGLGIVYLPEHLRAHPRFTGTALVWSDTGTLAAAAMQVNESIAGDGAAGTPLAAGWTPPALGVRLLPTWDLLGSQADLALTATGLPGTPLLVEVVPGTVTLGTDASCGTTTPLLIGGSGQVEQTLWVCSTDPSSEPTFTVRLWWDRGSAAGALDPADELIREELVRLPQ